MKLPRILPNVSSRDKLILGSSLIGLTLLYIMINRASKRAMLNKIYKAIDTGQNYYGTAEDAVSSNAFNVSYWKTVPSSATLLSAGKAAEIAVDIHDSFHFAAGVLYQVDVSDINNIFRQKISSKAQVSQVAYAYNKKYNKSLFDVLKMMNATFLGISSDDEFDKLVAYVTGLKDY